MADTGKILFEDPATAVKREVGKLLAQGVKFNIALGSAGLDAGIALLNDVLDIDLVVNGGGTDRFLFNGTVPEDFNRD